MKNMIVIYVVVLEDFSHHGNPSLRNGCRAIVDIMNTL
jgi:hypothetical protein